MRRPLVKKTTALDLLGTVCLAIFAFAIWPPACLLVIGVSALAQSWFHDGEDDS